MKKSRQRLISILLAVIMAFSLLPTAVWAAQGEEAREIVMEEPAFAPDEVPETPVEEPAAGLPGEGERPALAPGDQEQAELLAYPSTAFSESAMVPPTIPGWRQETSTSLHTDRKYIIVSQDTPATGGTPNYYVLYPGDTSTTAGNGIGSNGTVTASLAISGENVTVTHLAATPVSGLTLASCQFSPVASGNNWQLKFDTGTRYLTIGNDNATNYVFSTTPTSFILTLANAAKHTFSIRNPKTGDPNHGRVLDFNCASDTTNGFGGSFHTNFWGPSPATGMPHYPIYLYFYIADRLYTDDLAAAITAAAALSADPYTEDSWQAMQTALTNARTVKDAVGSTQAQVDQAEQDLENAVAALVKKPVYIPGYTQVKTLDGVTDGYYLIVAHYTQGGQDKYAALYPGGTGDTAANAKVLTLTDGTQLTFPSGVTAESGENAFLLMNGKWQITATNPTNSTKYVLALRGAEHVVYQNAASDTSEITVALTNAAQGYFSITGSSTLLFLSASSKFNQGSSVSGHETEWFPDMLLFRSNTKGAPPRTLGHAAGTMVAAAAGATANYDNSWAFVGGRAMQGKYADVGNVRNLVGQFEEYIRWTVCDPHTSGHNNMQRFTINTAYETQTLAQIVSADGWERVTAVDPRAAVYLPDPAEMTSATVPESFKTDLKSFIDKALALRENTGFAVVMKPWTNAANADAYTTAIGEVITEIENDAAYNQTRDRVVVVNGANLTDKVNADDYPNAAGHTELAKALATAFYGNANNFQAVNNTDYITPVANDYDEYLLPQYSATAEGDLTAPQQKIKTMVENDAQPLTWLFMGDSITHGAAWLAGHDSISQLFEKFVKEDLGRSKDVIVNTAISGSVVDNLVGDNLRARMTKYNADVIAVMIGTNDSAASNNVTAADMKTDLTTIINAAIAAKSNAVVVLRTPPPGHGFDINRVNRLEEYVDVARELETAYPNNVIVVDQYNEMDAYVMKTDTEVGFFYHKVYNTTELAGNIHPGPIGHLWMTRMLIDGLGLWNDSYAICRMHYNLGLSEKLSPTHGEFDISAALTHAPSGEDPTKTVVTLDTRQLEAILTTKVVYAAELTVTVDGTAYKAGTAYGGTPRVTIPKTTGEVEATVTILGENSTTGRGGYYDFSATVDLDEESPVDPTITEADWTLTTGNATAAVASTNGLGQLILPSGGSSETLKNNPNVPVFTNATINAAIQGKMTANETRSVSFTLWPDAGSGVPNCGVAINASQLNTDTQAYYIGHDSQGWYVEIYKPGATNGVALTQRVEGAPIATTNEQVEVRIQWTDTDVEFYLDGTEYAVPAMGDVTLSPNVVFKTGNTTSLILSDVHYSGDGVLDTYFLTAAYNRLLRYQDQKDVYVPETWQNAETALAEAKELRALVHRHDGTEHSKTDADVTAAIAKLETARAGLTYKITGAEHPVAFREVTDAAQLTEGVYAIYTPTPTSDPRILHHAVNGTQTNQCGASNSYDSASHTLNIGSCGVMHQWKLVPLAGQANKFYIQSMTTDGRYLNSTGGASDQRDVTDAPEEFTVQVVSNGVTIQNAAGKYFWFNGTWRMNDTAPTTPLKIFKETVVDSPVGGNLVTDWRTLRPANGTTTAQPYITNTTAGSANFRIPALLALKHQTAAQGGHNGRILSAIDARWSWAGDGQNLDTLVSWSDNQGETWTYHLANYFGDATDTQTHDGATFIDPVMVEAEDGTIYMMTDLYPGGVAITGGLDQPHAATGYQMVGDKLRLVLYVDPVNQTDVSWSYYAGDPEADGCRPIYRKDNAVTSYYLDDHYYLYNRGENAGRNLNRDRIYCQRLGSSDWVQQNIFFRNSVLHVRKASYLWIVKSVDGGETWSAPIMVNDQVRTGEHGFYGTGPGAGLSFVDRNGRNTIILPTYTFQSGAPDSAQAAGFIYSSDNGVTWARSEDATDRATHWSSESALVQINFTTVRQFYRDGHSTLWYTDHTLNETGENAGTWTAGTPVNTGTPIVSNCQLSAIRYSQRVNGKPAIIVSVPLSGSPNRTHGKLYVFTLNADEHHTMNQIADYDVTAAGVHYGYSSIAERANGDIAVLYEFADNEPRYTSVAIRDLLGSEAHIGDDQTLAANTVEPVILYPTNAYDIYNFLKTADAVDDNGKRIADYLTVDYHADGALILTGLQTGTLNFTLNQSIGHPDHGVEVTVNITDNVGIQASDWEHFPNHTQGVVTVSDDGESYVFTGNGSNFNQGDDGDSFRNPTLDAAISALGAGADKYVSFDFSTTNTTQFGFAIRVSSSSLAYYIGRNNSGWYFQRYNGRDNAWSDGQLSSPGVTANAVYSVRIQWNDAADHIRLWIDGNELTLPNGGSFHNVPNENPVAQFIVRAGGGTLKLSNLRYSGQSGTLDTFILDAAIAQARLRIDSDAYSSTSVTRLQAALNAAQAVKTDSAATQADVDAAAAALEEALGKLVQKITGAEEPGTTIDVYNFLEVTSTTQLANGEDGAPGTYAIYSPTGNRILHRSNGGTTNQCRDDNAYNSADHTLNVGAHGVEHQWTIAPVTGGYTIRSQTADGHYLTSGGSSATAQRNTSATPETFTLEVVSGGVHIKNAAGKYFCFVESGGNSWHMTDTAPATPMKLFRETKSQIPFTGTKHTDWRALRPADGDTVGQPYASGTGGSDNFRIPAIITLKNQKDPALNGRLVSAVDARWNTNSDGWCLDTMVSYSDNNGDNWHYTFANYFGDSQYKVGEADVPVGATAFIDPVIVEGEDGTIYLLTDLHANGRWTFTLEDSSGFVEIDGKDRLVLYTMAEGQTDTNWSYYVGDYGAPVNGTAYAPILDKYGDDSGYYIDDYHYLYHRKGAVRDVENDKIYCARLDTEDWIQQNIFFHNAVLHIRNTTYIRMITSKDGGQTWSKPTLLTNQIRDENDSTYPSSIFVGVGPGAGTRMDDGTLVMPIYSIPGMTAPSPSGQASAAQLATTRAAVIISEDNGVTWRRQPNTPGTHRTTESAPVAVGSRLYFFNRRDEERDFTYFTSDDKGATWTEHTLTGFTCSNGCQLSAIKYSKNINGKTAIILSAPYGGRRTGGRIFLLSVEADGTLSYDPAYCYDVNATAEWYAYSSLTEITKGDKAGDIALLYENQNNNPCRIQFVTIPIENITHSAEINEPEPEATPNAAPDYIAEKFTGLEPNTDYTVNGKAVTSDAAGAIPMEDRWLGTAVQIVRTARDSAHADSAPQSLTLAARSAAPEVSGFTVTAPTAAAGNGSVSGITAELEYSLDNGSTWHAGSGSPVSAAGNTTVMIRRKATAAAPKSESVTVLVPAYTDPGQTAALTFTPAVPTASPASAAAASVTYTLAAAPAAGTTYAVYADAACTTPVAGASASVTGSTLTLTLPNPPQEAVSYYITATAPGKAESNPAQVNVEPYVEPTISEDAKLSGLALSAGVLSPAFSPDNANYTVNVSTRVSSIAVTPTAATRGAAVTVNGETVASGSASSFIALEEGENTVSVVVTAVSGNIGTYTLTVTRGQGGSVPDTPTPPGPSGGGSISGGSSGGVTGSKTNPDGSVTTTVTDPTTGTVTETTKYPDGTEEKVTTGEDGSVDRTTTTSDGVVVRVTEVPEQDAAVSVTVPKHMEQATVSVNTQIDYTTVAIDNATGAKVSLSVPDEGLNTLMMKVDGSSQYTIVREPNKFEDVDGHWAKNAIDFTAAHDFFQGTSETSFSPDMGMSRAMMVTVLARFDGADTSGGATWYEAGAQWAKDNNISDGANLDQQITREQLATMLWRYAGCPESDQALAFPDAEDVSSFAQVAMRWAVEHGLLIGTDAGLLDPLGDASRAQVSTIMLRFSRYLVK